MKRIKFWLCYSLAILSKIVWPKKYLILIKKAYAMNGVIFNGPPAYIDPKCYIDISKWGGVVFGKEVVISTQVIILSHDWSFLTRMKALGKPYSQEMADKAFGTVTIGDYSFIGAGAILLPGSKIGNHCIVGAGAVVKGEVEDYSVVVGNPARKIKDIRK